MNPKQISATKYALNKVGSLLYSTVLGMLIPDVTTGFRAFTPQVAGLPIKSDYTYTQEQVVRAVKSHYRVISVPVRFYARHNGESRLIKTPVHYLWQTVKNARRMLS